MHAWVGCIRTPLAEPPGPFVLQHNHSGAIGTQNMKKTLTVLAVMAIAAAAHADVIASWSFLDGELTNDGKPTAGTAANLDKVTVGDLVRNDMNKNGGSGNILTAAGWAGADAYVGFTVSVAQGWEIAGASMGALGKLNAANSGPAKLDWQVDGVTKDTWTPAAGSATTGSTPPDANLDTIDDSKVHNIRLVYQANSGQAGGGTGAPASNGTGRIGGDLQFKGTIQEASAVPEPATLSLLGLGALAMALRRKLRK